MSSLDDGHVNVSCITPTALTSTLISRVSPPTETSLKHPLVSTKSLNPMKEKWDLTGEDNKLFFVEDQPLSFMDQDSTGARTRTTGSSSMSSRSWESSPLLGGRRQQSSLDSPMMSQRTLSQLSPSSLESGLQPLYTGSNITTNTFTSNSNNSIKDQTGDKLNVSALTENNNKGNHVLNLKSSDCLRSGNLINNDKSITSANKTNDAKLQMSASTKLLSENSLNASHSSSSLPTDEPQLLMLDIPPAKSKTIKSEAVASITTTTISTTLSTATSNTTDLYILCEKMPSTLPCALPPTTNLSSVQLLPSNLSSHNHTINQSFIQTTSMQSAQSSNQMPSISASLVQTTTQPLIPTKLEHFIESEALISITPNGKQTELNHNELGILTPIHTAVISSSQQRISPTTSSSVLFSDESATVSPANNKSNRCMLKRQTSLQQPCGNSEYTRLCPPSSKKLSRQTSVQSSWLAVPGSHEPYPPHSAESNGASSSQLDLLLVPGFKKTAFCSGLSPVLSPSRLGLVKQRRIEEEELVEVEEMENKKSQPVTMNLRDSTDSPRSPTLTFDLRDPIESPRSPTLTFNLKDSTDDPKPPTLTSNPSEGTDDTSFPLITVTINPMEQNEETMEYIPESQSPSPPSRINHRGSIGSASSLDDEDPDSRMHRLRLNSCSVRRLSDISHINQLRRETGMSHLTSEFYELKKVDPDRVSLDSIHVRVLERCANKYQAPERSSVTGKCFVIITTVLTTLGITYGFWFKNFGPGGGVETRH